MANERNEWLLLAHSLLCLEAFARSFAVDRSLAFVASSLSRAETLIHVYVIRIESNILQLARSTNEFHAVSVVYIYIYIVYTLPSKDLGTVDPQKKTCMSFQLDNPPPLHSSSPLSSSDDDDAVINHSATPIKEPPAMPAFPSVSPNKAKAKRLENIGCVVYI